MNQLFCDSKIVNKCVCDSLVVCVFWFLVLTIFNEGAYLTFKSMRNIPITSVS